MIIAFQYSASSFCLNQIGCLVLLSSLSASQPSQNFLNHKTLITMCILHHLISFTSSFATFKAKPIHFKMGCTFIAHLCSKYNYITKWNKVKNKQHTKCYMSVRTHEVMQYGDCNQKAVRYIVPFVVKRCYDLHSLY